MGWILNVFQRSLGAIDRISEVLEADPFHVPPGAPVPLHSEGPSRARSESPRPADAPAATVAAPHGDGDSPDEARPAAVPEAAEWLRPDEGPVTPEALLRATRPARMPSYRPRGA